MAEKSSTPAADQPAAARHSYGWFSLDRMEHPVLRVARPPDLTDRPPLENAIWQSARPLPPLVDRGHPEPAGQRTSVHLLQHAEHLYIAARCAGSAGESGPDDSLELILTQGETAVFPYIHLQFDSAGNAAAWRHLRPGEALREVPRRSGREASRRQEDAAISSTYFDAAVTPLDPALLRHRIGRTDDGWWLSAALPLAELGITGPRWRANVMRHHAAAVAGAGTGTDRFSWIDLWGGKLHDQTRLGFLRVVDHLPPAGPRLVLPAAVAVGWNEVRLEMPDGQHFVPAGESAAPALHINDQPVENDQDGRARFLVERYGTVTLRLGGRGDATQDEELATTFSAEAPRPLLIEAAEAFHTEAQRPLPVDVQLHLAGDQQRPVRLEVLQGGRAVGSKVASLPNGTHRVEIELRDCEAGEVEIRAEVDEAWRAREGAGATAGAARLLARHHCVIGRDRESYDRYRDGIDRLPLKSRMRAGLADACAYLRLLQAGDGRYRYFSHHRGWLGTSEWDQSLAYAFAVLYTADWPENPWRGDERFLHCAIAGMEWALAPQLWHETRRHPHSRNLQAYLLAYQILREHVPPAQAEYWRDRLIQLAEATVGRWVKPATYTFSSFTDDFGTGTNHWAYHVANVYTAGRIFDRADWRELAGEQMRRLARHERDGCFAERRGVPVIGYSRLTLNALGQYFAQSGDESVHPALLRAVEFSVATVGAAGNKMLLHDGRVNEPIPPRFGDFALSLTPQGRHLVHSSVAARITTAARPSDQNGEYWFRAAETIPNLVSGPEQPLPERHEFAFFDGRALVARRDGFVYGLSALCALPTRRRFWVDPQNHLELEHVEAGQILSGANSQGQPEAGSFHRHRNGGAVYLPLEGHVERAESGHAAYLCFDGFNVRLTCRILTPRHAQVIAELLDVQGEEPVIFSFFPVAAGAGQLPAGQQSELAMERVVITTSEPVRIQQGFQIISPYSMKYIVGCKSTRAGAVLRPYRPLVLDVRVVGRASR